MIVSPLTVVEGGPGAANTRFRRFTGLSPILWKAIAWIATASCRASRPQGHDVGTRAQRVQVVGPRLHHLLALGHVLRAVVGGADLVALGVCQSSEEHTSELQSLMRNSYAVFCLKKTNTNTP